MEAARLPIDGACPGTVVRINLISNNHWCYMLPGCTWSRFVSDKERIYERKNRPTSRSNRGTVCAECPWADDEQRQRDISRPGTLHPVLCRPASTSRGPP